MNGEENLVGWREGKAPPGGLRPPTSPASGEVKSYADLVGGREGKAPPGGLRPPTSPASGEVKPSASYASSAQMSLIEPLTVRMFPVVGSTDSRPA